MSLTTDTTETSVVSDDGVAELTLSPPLEVLSVSYGIDPARGSGLASELLAALRREAVTVKVLVPGHPDLIDAVEEAEVAATLPDLFGAAARILSGTTEGLDLLIIDAPHLYGHPRDPRVGGEPDETFAYDALGFVAARIGMGLVPGYRPDIVHAQDWQAGLAPAYLAAEGTARPRTVVTIRDLAAIGKFPATTPDRSRLPAGTADAAAPERKPADLLKAGLVEADRIVTVSPSYAAEIATPEGGLGWDGLLRGRGTDLVGIRDGIDETAWNPSTDTHLAARYEVGDMAGRARNKAALQSRFGLDPAPDALLFGALGPFTEEKGFDLVLEALPLLTAIGGQLVLLGAGDAALERRFQAAAERHSGRIGLRLGDDDALARLVLAGADAILVPSRVEPCGETQLRALRYGAMPVASRVGGLIDTIVDANEMALASGAATGVMFSPVTTAALEAALRRTAGIFRDPETWAGLVVAGMGTDVSWRQPARKLAALYRDLLASPSSPAAGPLP